MKIDRHAMIQVSAHAVDRYRQRARVHGDLFEVADMIRAEVRAAISTGRVQNHKPKRFRLYRESGRMLPDGQYFVFRADGSMGWIVKPDGKMLVVVTTLSPTWAADAA